MRPITTLSQADDFAKLYGRSRAFRAYEALVVALANATMQAIERDRYADNVSPEDAVEAEKAVQSASSDWSMMMSGADVTIEEAVMDWRCQVEQEEMDRLFDMPDGGENRWTQPVGGYV
jgi:hypothetical protein